jgi:hypothetical protein
VPRGGIEPPTLRFSGSFFASKLSNVEVWICLTGELRSMG